MTVVKDRRVHPPVGYQGGKRRLVARLRPLLPIEEMTCYVEPFIGMGAVYIDVRARGYDGLARIADSHPQVLDYWMLLHHAPMILIEACEDISSWPRTVDGYYEMKALSIDGIVERTARFLWLLNYTFGNQPSIYDGDRWRGFGTKLSSSERWGKTFPWEPCVERLRVVAELVSGSPTLIFSDGLKLLAEANTDAVVYADPPYVGTTGYTGSTLAAYTSSIVATKARVVLSESSDVAGLLDGWTAHDGSVVARLSAGTGAEGKRREMIYCRDALK